jgi:hypothetical protein
MTTYSANTDLTLDSGEDLSDFLKSSLSAAGKTTALDNARERAYRVINQQHLYDKTLTPASLTTLPGLKQIEIDIVIANVLAGSFSAGSKRKIPEKLYRDRATNALKALQYPATATSPTASSGNTGNGTVSAITCNDEITSTEIWRLIALSSSWFRLEGTRTKGLPDVEVGVAYPDISEHNFIGSDYGKRYMRGKEYGDFPVYFTITAGDTAFEQYDFFTFNTFSASRPKQHQNKMVLG